MTDCIPTFVFPPTMREHVADYFELSDEERATLATGPVHRFGYNILLTPQVPTDAGYRQINATIARLGARDLFAQVPYRTLALLQSAAR